MNMEPNKLVIFECVFTSSVRRESEPYEYLAEVPESVPLGKCDGQLHAVVGENPLKKLSVVRVERIKAVHEQQYDGPLKFVVAVFSISQALERQRKNAEMRQIESMLEQRSKHRKHLEELRKAANGDVESEEMLRRYEQLLAETNTDYRNILLTNASINASIDKTGEGKDNLIDDGLYNDYDDDDDDIDDGERVVRK